MKLPTSKNQIKRDVVTIRAVEDNVLHVTYNFENGGIVELPSGGSNIPPQPTGFSICGNLVEISVAQSRNKALTNVLYKSHKNLSDTTLAQLGVQLGQCYQKCDVRINKTPKRRVKLRK